MINAVNVKLLRRYRVDRGKGGTADGSTELVILVLQASDAPELAYAVSKADAMIIAQQIMLAAREAQADMARG